MALVLTSSAFADQGRIPTRHTCDGANTAPALSWSGAPRSARGLVLLVDDPDAPGGTFCHWCLYDIPLEATAIKAGFTAGDVIGQSKQARNDFGRKQYDGPCPPPGGLHHYRFRLLALRTAPLKVGGDPHCRDVEREAQAWLAEETVLIGTYSRKRKTVNLL